jgi:YYY domain-containing protein
LLKNSEEGNSLTPDQQIFSVASWLVILFLLQLSVYPSLRKTFGTFSFPISFPVSVLAFTIISWYCGLARIPVQTALVPFIALISWHLFHHNYRIDELKGEWHWVALFLILFFLMLDVRFVNPTISYAEKFMDHGFLASVMRNPVVPPLDPWFSGGTLDVYYYLGYWMFGCLAIISGVPSNIAFNLALPTVFALAGVVAYAIGTLMLERFRWVTLLIFFLPNPSFFYNLAIGTPLTSVVWNSTRTIANTINEYPLFSFIWGDVHAHVISIFNQVFLIFLLLFAYKRWESLDSRGKWLVCILSALSLGSMPLINTWDVLIYAPITLLVGGLILWRTRTSIHTIASWIYLCVIPPLAILFYLPFYSELQAHFAGIGIVLASLSSSVPEFLLVNGLFIAIFVVVLHREIIRRPILLLVAVPFVITGYLATAVAVVPLVYLLARTERDFCGILSMVGLVVLIFCELFYLKDNMGDTYFRMNTVFKFYIPAWLMLGISSFTIVAQKAADWKKIPVFSFRESAVVTITVVCILFALPFAIQYNAGYGTGTLDGLAYLNTTHPGDAGGVAYLRALPGDTDRIVEAENGDYSYYSRISSFTGIPAIIGQPFHEFMWRGDTTGWFSRRPTDIQSIYENPNQTILLMRKYNATLLYVGDAERERYNVSLPSAGLEMVYSADNTDIYRLAG